MSAATLFPASTASPNSLRQISVVAAKIITGICVPATK
jgi:hypothetical protein